MGVVTSVEWWYIGPMVEAEKVALAIARMRRVDCYDSSHAAGLERNDFYLHQQSRDVVLYMWDNETRVGPELRADTLVCRFIKTEQAMFHLELNADYLPVCDLVSPSHLGITLQYRNECVFVRCVSAEALPGVLVLIDAVIEAGLIRRKR